MTIAQAMRLLKCKNEFQLSKALEVNYQAVQYWRKKLDSKEDQVRLAKPWMLSFCERMLKYARVIRVTKQPAAAQE